MPHPRLMNAELDAYFEARGKIHGHFGYAEDWAVIPMMDSREYHWRLYLDIGGGGSIRFAETEEGLDDPNEKYYEESIYTQRHLPKWVYRTEGHTMVCCDTQVDGNKFLRIFDNEKERSL